MNIKTVLVAFERLVSSVSIRDISLNYSKTDIGIRNRHCPAGFIARDEGVAEGYAGYTRMLLSTSGLAMLSGIWTALKGTAVHVTAADRERLVLQGVVMSKDAYGSVPYIVAKRSLKDLWVVGSPPQCDPNTGVILNPIPLADVFRPSTIFDPAPSPLPSASTEKFQLADRLLWSKP